MLGSSSAEVVVRLFHPNLFQKRLLPTGMGSIEAHINKEAALLKYQVPRAEWKSNFILHLWCFRLRGPSIKRFE